MIHIFSSRLKFKTHHQLQDGPFPPIVIQMDVNSMGPQKKMHGRKYMGVKKPAVFFVSRWLFQWSYVGRGPAYSW